MKNILQDTLHKNEGMSDSLETWIKSDYVLVAKMRNIIRNNVG